MLDDTCKTTKLHTVIDAVIREHPSSFGFGSICLVFATDLRSVQGVMVSHVMNMLFVFVPLLIFHQSSTQTLIPILTSNKQRMKSYSKMR